MPLTSTLYRAAALWLIVLTNALTAQTVTAQAGSTSCLLLPVEPAERARAAALVVEAEVVAQRSFWDARHRHIFTANTLQVYKLLKGKWTAGTPLTVVTEGGIVDLDRETLTNTLALQQGQQGLFFLQPVAFAGVAEPGAWMAYASQQGFIRYDVIEASAGEPFRRYPLIDDSFYRLHTGLTGQPLHQLQPNPVLVAAVQRRLSPPTVAARITAPVISGLAPQVVTAGTGDVLTIQGSGFGTARGSVAFRNANDGGATFTPVLPVDIVLWTDNRIQVRVPSYTVDQNTAGTGNVRVTTADQLSTISSGLLTVTYAVLTVQETTSGQIYQTELFNQNGSGGYSFRPDPLFLQNSAAMQAFGRALTSWRCQTAMNWELGSARPARGVANDDVNALEFDQGSELPARVLGRTTSYFLGCRDANGQIRFWVKEIDMQYDDATAWQYGPAVPAPPQIDFETVALHELGHGHQLAHIIAPAIPGTPTVPARPAAVMHYAVERGQFIRQLDFSRDVLGGFSVLQRSAQPKSCGPAPLLPDPLVTSLRPELVENGGRPTVRLSWTTREACNVQAFVLERSTDNQTWTVLGQVPPAGARTYTFSDAQPPDGLVRYRLRVQLTNGLSPVAAPVLVRTTPGSEFALFPNPVRDEAIRLEYSAPATGELTLRLYDAVGRYLDGRRLQVNQAGINVLTYTPPPLKAGWYVLRWESGDRRGAAPFVRVD